MSWKAKVEATCFDAGQFPLETFSSDGAPLVPEVAVAGRSNVGKSSLVNALLGARLAHVGATPGKTRSVNFYSVAGDGAVFRLVDLPGYGYAQRSKAERRGWSRLTASYVEKRKSLALVCHLVDFRHGLLANDRALQGWLSEQGRPILVVFTKADKTAKSKRRVVLQQYVRDGLLSIDAPLVTSAEEPFGIADLQALLEGYASQGRPPHPTGQTHEHHA
ncbi:MAG: ribosome biogenesis GTP-binding protein YihA/YsxC [Synergistaceae bacterium]|jgi:GTP-binding protein|nr:ribosome biogenesis GTP-binding protein YihA/YsxC [Synergistaceae bacterium]